jgi:predicted DNA-binding transcriptional regulator AlpA
METNTIKDLTNHRMIDITSLEFINQIAQILPNVLNLKQSNDNEFIDDTEVTKMLGIKKATLHSMTSKRILTYYQPCKANLFKKSDILAFIESSKRPNKSEILESAESYLAEKDNKSKTTRSLSGRLSRRDTV